MVRVDCICWRCWHETNGKVLKTRLDAGGGWRARPHIPRLLSCPLPPLSLAEVGAPHCSLCPDPVSLPLLWSPSQPQPFDGRRARCRAAPLLRCAVGLGLLLTFLHEGAERGSSSERERGTSKRVSERTSPAKHAAWTAAWNHHGDEQPTTTVECDGTVTSSRSQPHTPLACSIRTASHSFPSRLPSLQSPIASALFSLLSSLAAAMSGSSVSSGFYLMVTGQVDACQMQGFDNLYVKYSFNKGHDWSVLAVRQRRARQRRASEDTGEERGGAANAGSVRHSDSDDASSCAHPARCWVLCSVFSLWLLRVWNTVSLRSPSAAAAAAHPQTRSLGTGRTAEAEAAEARCGCVLSVPRVGCLLLLTVCLSMLLCCRCLSGCVRSAAAALFGYALWLLLLVGFSSQELSP